jgi:hypothetical protein
MKIRESLKAIPNAVKENLIEISLFGFFGLKALQGFAMDASRMFANKSKPSLSAYGLSEHAKIGAAISAGVFAAEGVGKLESILRVPKSVRGLMPALAATLGISALNYFYGDTFGTHSENYLEATKTLMNNYGGALYTFTSFNPNVNPTHLTGATFAAYSGLRFAKNLLGGFTRYADRRDSEQKLRENRGE